MFIPIWGNNPIWLICFRWVGSTTNQLWLPKDIVQRIPQESSHPPVTNPPPKHQLKQLNIQIFFKIFIPKKHVFWEGGRRPASLTHGHEISGGLNDDLIETFRSIFMNIQHYGVMNLSWASCIYVTDLGIECVKCNYIKSTKLSKFNWSSKVTTRLPSNSHHQEYSNF